MEQRLIIDLPNGARADLHDARMTRSTLSSPTHTGRKLSNGVQEGFQYEHGRQFHVLRAFVRDEASGEYLWTSGIFTFDADGEAFWREEARLFHASGDAQRRLFVEEYI